MLNKRIKITGMEMTPAISDYVHKRIDALTKFIDPSLQSLAEVEIGRITKHHNKGDVYKAEMHLTVGKDLYRIDVIESDLYVAIDMMKDRVIQEVTKMKDKKISLFRKGQQNFGESPMASSGNRPRHL